MIVRGNPGWSNELPDRFKDLFEDEVPEEIAAVEANLEGHVPEEHLELVRNDQFHQELFAKLSDSELKTARKLCPFYRILRFFRRDTNAGGG